MRLPAPFLQVMLALHEDEIPAVVCSAVHDVEVVDLHTHLFPPSHEELMLWGIDEMLTYHYLVSEFFMVAPMSISYEEFFAKPKAEQVL